MLDWKGPHKGCGWGDGAYDPVPCGLGFEATGFEVSGRGEVNTEGSEMAAHGGEG